MPEVLSLNVDVGAGLTGLANACISNPSSAAQPPANFGNAGGEYTIGQSTSGGGGPGASAFAAMVSFLTGGASSGDGGGAAPTGDGGGPAPE